jgi:hypothetical protein
MSAAHGMNIGILYGSVDLTSYFKSLTVARKGETADVTTFGPGIVPKQFIAGPTSAELTADGVWDGGLTAVDATLDSLFAVAATVVSAAWQGFATRGQRATILSGIEAQHDTTGGISTAVLVKLMLQGSGLCAQGWVIRDLATRTSTSAGGAANSTDTGTTTSNGYLAALHTTGTPTGTAPTQQT